MKILILSSSTGGGHDMRARSLCEWAKKENPDTQVATYQALEETHLLYRFGVGLYNFIQKHCPVLHHIYFNYLELAGMCTTPWKILGRQKFQHMLQCERPDVIVSTHGTLNHGFFELARDLGSKNHIACVTYCGEMSGGYGFSRHWVNPEADLFIGATQEICNAAILLGMPVEKTFCGGFLLHPDFWQDEWSAEERKHFIQNRLHFDPNQFLLVLGTGAVGANNHLALLNALHRENVLPQVLVLCGKSEKTRAKVEKWSAQHPDLPVKALPYTREMPQILRAASAVVARPGTGTTSEAVLSACPIIHNTLGGVMPQERITVKYCRKYNLSETIRRPGQLPKIVAEWMQQSGKLEKIRQNMTKIRPATTPKDILERLKTLTQSQTRGEK